MDPIDRTPRASPRLVVGIGASAGGLQAFRELLSELPSDGGMAFVLVQHLDPDHASLLSELLVPHSDMDVRDAEHGDVLRPDTVYVIRPASALAVRDGRIELTEPTLHRGIRLPVDHLFRSLAREYGARSVGIVLSGAGSDGSSGLRDIKGAGGLTVAQDPESSGQPGMPQSAINTGLIDLVLAIDEVPQALARFAALPPGARIDPSAEAAEAAAALEDEERADETAGTASLDPSDLARLKAMLAAQIDFDLGVYKSGTIERRVLRRMLLSGFETMSVYLEHLRERPEEQQTLVRDLLISVTSFFRDPDAYAVLRENVVEPLIAGLDEQAEVRVWIPGCATGEEAYSVAMTLLDAAEERQKSIQLQIFATDVDQEALAVARAGVYPPSIVEHVSERRLVHYFQPLDGNGYRVRSGLRDLVSFAAHDLTKDPPFSRMHLVCCRNVLIYLTPEAQSHVLGVLHFALQPEAHLLLSTSESTGARPELFATVSKSARLYRKLGASRAIAMHHSGAKKRRRTAREDDFRDESGRPTSGRATSSDPARRAVLEAWAPPTLVVSEEGAIVFMHGELGPYLAFPQGDDPRLEFDAMLREEIATRTRGALYRCRRHGTTVVALSSPDAERANRMRVTARPVPSLGAGMVMLTFEEVDESAETAAIGTATDGAPIEVDGTADEAVLDELENELRATREDLRNTVEELETSNEELRSSNEESMSMNEELQSANEELEATTEELRSLNEELTTVNSQLREKIEQLEHAHDDLGNFFSSARVAMVFLDERLRIKRFTPAAAELLGIDQGDVGRFTGDIARELLQRDLEEEARGVLEHLTVRSRELHVHDGRWFTRQVLPYRTENRRIEGVVVSLVEVTELKAATEGLAVRERQQRVIAQLGFAALRDTDPQAFLERTAREVQRTLDLDACAVLELQPGGRRLLMRAGTGWNEGLVGGACVDVETQAGHALEASEPVIVGEIATETRFAVADALVDHELSSGLCCSIRDGERAYGVIEGYTRERRVFDGEDADFLQAVANVVGSMINRYQVRLRATLQEGVSRALLKQGEPDEILGAVQECLSLELGTAVGEVWWLPEREGAPLDCRLVHTLPSERRREVEDCLCKRDARVTEDIVATALRERRAVWATDIGSPTMFGHDENARSLGFQSAYAFPIRAGGRTLAVMTLYSHRRPFTNDIFLRSLENVGSAVGETLARVDQERRAERLAEITQSSSDAIYSHDPDGVVTEWLPGAERLFGFEADEMLGRPFERLVPEALREETRAIVTRVLDGERLAAFETTRLTRDGRRLEVSVLSSPLLDGSGRAVGVTSTERDVSRLKETERRLISADRQKDEFLAMLGHELRNPLSSIRTAAELLKLSGSDDPEIRRTQTILERQSTHMAKLLDGLLDVSRIINGKIRLELASVDLADVCREVLEDSRTRAGEKSLSLESDLPGRPLAVNADRVRLVQVVDNLLSNALRYTPEGGSVTMSLTADDETATLRIGDDGVGIDGALLPHVFDVFRQSYRSLDRAEGGLGLGLSLVRSLVELHGGSVEARSEGTGLGSEFVVRLPLGDTPPPAPDGEPGTTSETLDILIVEDNADAADVVARVLERFGHRVTKASDGRRGIETALAVRPDVVLCDLGLPDGVTGYDVAKALRADSTMADTRLVALSGYGRPEDKTLGAEAGFDDHLTKPVGVDELRRALSRRRPR